jgi:hypothetical protein
MAPEPNRVAQEPSHQRYRVLNRPVKDRRLGKMSPPGRVFAAGFSGL